MLFVEVSNLGVLPLKSLLGLLELHLNVLNVLFVTARQERNVFAMTEHLLLCNLFFHLHITQLFFQVINLGQVFRLLNIIFTPHPVHRLLHLLDLLILSFELPFDKLVDVFDLLHLLGQSLIQPLQLVLLFHHLLNLALQLAILLLL